MMASMKPTTKASTKSSTPIRDVYSKSSSRAVKVVQSSDKQASPKSKSNAPSSSVNKVYTSKDHNAASKSQSCQGSRSKQCMPRRSQPATATAVKQTTSSKPKHQVKRATSTTSDEGKTAHKVGEKHAQGADTKEQKTGSSKVNGDKPLESSKLEDGNGSSDVGESKDGGSENNRRLLDVVRERCLAKGRHGIHGLGLLFRHLDVDYNKRIVFEELKDKLKDFGVDLSDGNLRALFK